MRLLMEFKVENIQTFRLQLKALLYEYMVFDNEDPAQDTKSPKEQNWRSKRWKEMHFCKFESQIENRAFSGLGNISQLLLATESRAFDSLQVWILAV